MSCMWKDKHDCAYCAVQFCDARTDEFNMEKATASASVPTYNGPDQIDKWLAKEFNICPGRCSSIEQLKYDVARAVAEKLTTSINLSGGGEIIDDSAPIDWLFFRTAAAKDILASLIEKASDIYELESLDKEVWCEQAIQWADTLIEKLKR